MIYRPLQTFLKRSSRHFLQLFLPTLLFVGLGSESFSQKFYAHLNGNAEVQPVVTDASGQVWARMFGDSLKVWGEFDDLGSKVNTDIAGGGHIHNGLAGENGGVEIVLMLTLDMDSMGGTLDSAMNAFELTADQKELLMDRSMYVNIHTLENGAGEIRGQLGMDESTRYTAIAYGSNSVHSVHSNASGAFLLELVGNELTVSGSFMGLEGDFDANVAGGIHLHSAKAGTNGGIAVSLTADVATDLKSGSVEADDNVFTLSDAQVEALENEEMYVNIHTTTYGAGEIRGQVLPENQTLYRAYLSGASQTPVVASTAEGHIMVAYTNDSIRVSGSFSNLSAAADTSIVGGIHIHSGMAGSNGGVEIVLNANYSNDLRSATIDASNNTFALSTEQKEALMMRGLYINVHSLNFPAGEIRGQIVPTANYYMLGFLSGSQETHNVISTGLGNTIAEVKNGELTLTGSFNNLASDFDGNVAGGAHLHAGLLGTSGPVQVLVNTAIDTDLRSGSFMASDNMLSISEGLEDTLRKRMIYLNIHTTAFGAGELRAQMLPESATYLYSKISGAQEVPSVNTEGNGGAVVEIKNGMAKLSGSFAMLGAEVDESIAGGAHIHSGNSGSNGGVLQALSAELSSDKMSGSFMASDNGFAVSKNIIDSMFHRMNYINIHTTEHASGEIRGQIMQAANAYFSTSLTSLSETDAHQSGAMGGLNFEWKNDALTAFGSFSMLESDLNEAIAGGAHIHKAFAGEDGAVSFALNLMVASDKRSATITADSNVFDLNMDDTRAAANGEFYVNVHSLDNAAGAIRGQILPSINYFPSNGATITSPSNNDNIALNGASTDEISMMWNEATDVNENELSYIIQLATDESFSDIFWVENAGDTMTYSWSYAYLDSVLNSLGVEVGMSASVYARVLASDGSVATAAEVINFNLERSIFTSLNAKAPLAWKVYPNPATNQLYVNVDNTENGIATMFTADGKEVKQIQIHGGMNNISIKGLENGVYFLQLKSDSNNKVVRILKK